MRRLTFITGAGLRRVLINGRKITFMTSELGDVPLEIDLDKLEDEKFKDKISKMKIDEKVLKQLSLLNTEEELVFDIKKDFQSTGWRLHKNELV